MLKWQTMLPAYLCAGLAAWSMSGAAPVGAADQADQAMSTWLRYDGERLPTDATPAWRMVVDTDRSQQRAIHAHDSVLDVRTTEPTDNAAWAMGTWDNDEGDEHWRLQPGGQATIDLHAAVDRSEGGGALQVQVSDGEAYWTLHLRPQSIEALQPSGETSQRVRQDNRALRAFRLVIEDNHLWVYGEGTGDTAGEDEPEPMLEAVGPSGHFADRARNALVFGDFSSGAGGRFAVRSLQWTVGTALHESPEPVDPPEAELFGDITREADGPSILFIGNRRHAHYGGASRAMFLHELAEEHGFEVAFREQEFLYHEREGEVDPDEFDQFDVLVYLNPIWPRPSGELTESSKRQWDAALAFVERGGGLVYFPWLTEPYQYFTQQAFADLGLEPLKAMPVDAGATRATLARIPWSRTERFNTEHSVTRDLTGLWVPVYAQARSRVGNANSWPFRVSDEWNVLAHYGEGVTLHPHDDFDGLAQSLPTASEQEEQRPALLAARDWGEGRIAYMGIHSAYHVVGGRAPAYEGIFLNEGLQGRGSDGEQLLVNLFQWLAEPAQANPDLGGAVTEREAFADAEFEPLPPREEPATFSPQLPGHRGVIGAISPRSGGESSVAEYAERARELGFDFLVVLDDLDRVTEAEYEQTDAEAIAASTDDFVCIAGLRFRDEVGNRYVTFRQGLRWPQDDMLTDDMRFQTVFDENITLGLGRWRRAHGHRSAIVHYRDRRDLESDDPYEYGTPPWDVRPYRMFHSVFTYNEDGEQIDDMTEEHKVVVAGGEHVHPVALTFLTHADDLHKVADGELPYTVRWADDLLDLPERSDEERQYRPTSYATQGPRITRWQWDTRDLVNNGKYWDWTYYHQRWGIGAESDAGLAKVEVWDGTDLVRRWPLGGETSFETVAVVNRHQLTMPLLVITDVNGNRAVSSGFQWRSHNLFVSWATDRQNTLGHSALPYDIAPHGSTAGGWPVPIQPKGPVWDNVRLNNNLSMLRFPGFDGQPSGNIRISPNFNLHTAEGEPSDGRYNRQITWPMGSHEAVVQESLFNHQLLPEQQGPHSWATLGPLRPSEVLEGRLRYTTFVRWGGDPAPVLVEGEFTFKQDIETDPGARGAFRIATLTGGSGEVGYRAVAVQNTGGRDRVYPMFDDQRDDVTASGDLPPGAFIYYFPSMLGSMGVVSLDDNLSYRLINRGNRNRANLYLGEPGQHFERGDTVRWRYLAITSDFADRTGTDTPRRIVNQLGIAGEPGYEVEAIDGEVASTNYILTLRPGGDGAGFRGRIVPGEDIRRHGLPASLPLVVEGLNDRWTAVLWDEGEQVMRPLPVAEGKSYAHYRDLPESRSLFMGHPFVSDDPEIILTAVQTGPESLYLYVHNPTDTSRDVTVEQARHFDAMSFESGGPWQWTLEPGEERHLHLGPETVWTPEGALAP